MPMPRYATIACCAVASFLLLFYPPMHGHNHVLLVFWSAVAGYFGRRWVDGLFVPVLAGALMVLWRFLYRGSHLILELKVAIIAWPVLLAFGGLGGLLGSWLARRRKLST
jgi:hypothetical protein